MLRTLSLTFNSWILLLTLAPGDCRSRFPVRFSLLSGALSSYIRTDIRVL